jgi:hypothetical protein
MDLDQLGGPLAGRLRSIEHEPHVTGEAPQLRRVAEAQGALRRVGVQADRANERVDLLGARPGQVEPEELIAVDQAPQLVRAGLSEPLHGPDASQRSGRAAAVPGAQ